MIKSNQPSPTHWFIFSNGKLLLENVAGKLEVPFQATPPINIPSTTRIHEITKRENDERYKALEINTEVNTDKYKMVGLRQTYDIIGKKMHDVAGKCSEILHWDKYSQYCPKCGTKTSYFNSITKLCPKCNNKIYPSLSPAVLVMIKKDDKIMLVHARNFPGTYSSLVAGFLEPGETLEECVQREVLEETGLKVKNIKYWGSQFWPYPSQIMAGFTCEYESGTVKLQDEELSHGGFFNKDNLPELPHKLSLARKMIDYWLDGQPEK